MWQVYFAKSLNSKFKLIQEIRNREIFRFIARDNKDLETWLIKEKGNPPFSGNTTVPPLLKNNLRLDCLNLAENDAIKAKIYFEEWDIVEFYEYYWLWKCNTYSRPEILDRK